MARDDDWAAAWVAEKIVAHSQIESALRLEAHKVRLTLKGSLKQVSIATMSAERVNRQEFLELGISEGTEFVVNVVKDAVYESSAIELSKSWRFGFGAMSDLYRAASIKSFRTYVDPETTFVLRGLQQHYAVKSVSRINNRLYMAIRGETRPALKILSLNQYDLTADAVRNGIAKFGMCNVILTSNPNCNLSTESVSAAKSCGVKILTWGELMKRLGNSH